jgi:hypothetical protein
MALNPSTSGPQAAPNSSTSGPQADPAAGSSPYLSWLGPLYAVSLVLIFVGERLTSSDTFRLIFSGLGVAGALVTTALRFVWTSQAPGERRSAERTLAILTAGGLVAVAIYFATNTETGRNLLGITHAAPTTRARIDGASMVVWIVLLTISAIPLLFGELALAPMRRAPRPELRRVHAAMAAGISISLAVIYTALFTFTAGELEYKIDFSVYRASRPSESTRNIAATATEPIKAMAFFPQLNDVGNEVEGYLREVGEASPNIKVEIYDRMLVPAIAKNAKATQDGVVVLNRGATHEIVTIGTEMKTALPKLKSLDGDFQKALIKVLRDAKIAYVTAGHGEINELSGAAVDEGKAGRTFRKLLESQNYAVKDLSLVQGLANAVPADATFVAVLGPRQALLPAEVESLQKYADKGGRLLLALDAEAKVDLDPLAAIAGVTVQKSLLANDKVYLRRRFNPSDRTILVTNRFSSHASVSTLSRLSARAPLAFAGATWLDKREGADQTIDFTIRALNETFNDDNGDFELTPSSSEKRSSFNLTAAVTKRLPAPEDSKSKEPLEMRAFVIADADALSDAALTNEPNVLFAVDVVRWLGGEESFSGAIASAEDVRIEHTKQKDEIWFYATIFGAPTLLLGIGLVVTLRKRGGGARAAKEKKG